MIINYHCKANKKVWAYQNFRVNDRYQCKDGNYLLWQNDMVNIGSKLGMTNGSDFRQFLVDVCEQIGAVLLTLPEAKEEQDGTVTRTLPTALDVRFQLDGETADEAVTEEEAPEHTEEETPEPDSEDNEVEAGLEEGAESVPNEEEASV
jgi:hypothetical protein